MSDATSSTVLRRGLIAPAAAGLATAGFAGACLPFDVAAAAAAAGARAGLSAAGEDFVGDEPKDDTGVSDLRNDSDPASDILD